MDFAINKVKASSDVTELWPQSHLRPLIVSYVQCCFSSAQFPVSMSGPRRPRFTSMHERSINGRFFDTSGCMNAM